jgi:hypothetical protein
MMEAAPAVKLGGKLSEKAPTCPKSKHFPAKTRASFAF